MISPYIDIANQYDLSLTDTTFILQEIARGAVVLGKRPADMIEGDDLKEFRAQAIKTAEENRIRRRLARDSRLDFGEDGVVRIVSGFD